MRISKLIKELEKFMSDNGDLDVVVEYGSGYGDIFLYSEDRAIVSSRYDGKLSRKAGKICVL